MMGATEEGSPIVLYGKDIKETKYHDTWHIVVR